jgi:hypothetical protein
MPDGLDPHRDDWVPVPLIRNEYDAEKKTYTIEFTAPKQLLLNPQFEAMVHDELLRNADRKGLVVEGQIMVTHQDKDAPETVAEASADETTARDDTVRDVLEHPEKEAEVQAEQDAMESPYKMSDAEKEWRAKQRQSMRQTADEAFGFVKRTMGDEVRIKGRKFEVDRDAFMEGFYGRPIGERKVDIMVVRAEALIAMDMGLSGDEPGADLPVIDPDLMNIEIPDDLSELDEE